MDDCRHIEVCLPEFPNPVKLKIPYGVDPNKSAQRLAESLGLKGQYLLQVKSIIRTELARFERGW